MGEERAGWGAVRGENSDLPDADWVVVHCANDVDGAAVDGRLHLDHTAHPLPPPAIAGEGARRCQSPLSECPPTA